MSVGLKRGPSFREWPFWRLQLNPLAGAVLGQIESNIREIEATATPGTDPSRLTQTQALRTLSEVAEFIRDSRQGAGRAAL